MATDSILDRQQKLKEYKDHLTQAREKQMLNTFYNQSNLFESKDQALLQQER